jgi:hypothetical protein
VAHAKQQSSVQGLSFDVVLLDEASQMTEPTSLVRAEWRRQPHMPGIMMRGADVDATSSVCGTAR